MSDASARPPVTGRVGAIDYGTVRIGLAISDPQRRLASPYENYTRRNPDQDARRFKRFVDEEQIVLLVVGLPVHLDGHESQKSLEARAFGKWLGQVTGVPVVFFDERFTSVEAEQMLLDADMTRKRRKRRLDMLAAQILLSGYLEQSQAEPDEPGALDG